MKRDMDLIREILLKIEGLDDSQYGFPVCGYQQEVVDYNMDLLISAGLVNGKMTYSQHGPAKAFVQGLTWGGHDFLEAVRSESVWAKTKQHLKDHDLEGISFELIKPVALSIVKQLIGLDS